MASYWIVVPRGNAELFELLSMAFRGRTGFNVIMDRRAAAPAAPGIDRRARPETLGPDEIVIAEQAERSATMSDESSVRVRTAARRPIARRVPKHTESAARRSRTASALPAGGAQRLFTL
jgi:hypothetical protein